MCLCVQAQTKTENWCGVLQEVALPGTYADPEAFLEAAVRFANEDCWGTLSCALMVRSTPDCHHPLTTVHLLPNWSPAGGVAPPCKPSCFSPVP